MNRKISKSEYIKALSTKGVLKDKSIELLNLLCDAPNCEATAPQLAQMLGYQDFPPVNALIGKLGKRIANHLGVKLSVRNEKRPGWWQVVARGEAKPEGFTWKLRKELLEALADLGLLQEFDAKLYPEAVAGAADMLEGKSRKVVVNAYERNVVARDLCIKHYGTICSVCDFDFRKKYGPVGAGFIHVHHLIELSSISKEYRVRPTIDLRPVCPNCHAMLHQRNPAYTIEELRKMIEEAT